MADKGTYRCKNCRSEFTARTADRARGWALYCSKACKAREQERRTGQHHAHQYRSEFSGSILHLDRNGEIEGFADAHLFSNEEHDCNKGDP